MPKHINALRVKSWILSCAEKHNSSIERLVYSFITKKHMLSINLKYMKHNTDTDIITFPYGTKESIVAEVFISTELAFENAKEFNQSTENEIIRLISHGLLHCMGFNDKSPAQKQEMTNQEDRFIKMFHVKH